MRQMQPPRVRLFRRQLKPRSLALPRHFLPDLCTTMLFPRFLDLPARVAGHLLQAPADATAEVRHLLLDSRRPGLPAGAVFFALRGLSHDGHRYLPDLYAQGVRLFIVADDTVLPGGLAAYAGAGILAVVSPVVGSSVKDLIQFESFLNQAVQRQQGSSRRSG